GDKASGTLRLAGENNVASFDQVLTAQFIWTERMTYAGKMRRDGGGRSNDAANVSRAAPATTSRGGRAATDIAGSYNNGDFIVHGDGRVESHHFEGEKTGRITKFSARAFSVDWSDSTFTSFWFRSGVSNGFYTESRATFAGGQHVPHWYHKDGTPEFKWRNSNDDDDEVW
ncbi:MAG TPA: hypothetical protein VFA65_00800, partial [Bryobacteraceae bacterium]|nr:hypothetical protein [Bryobacteraceae bacterium]